MKRTIKLLSVLLLVVLLITSVFSVSAFAGTRTVTVKKASYTSTCSIASKKAAVVKKGTSKIKMNGKTGFIKFTAPKKGTYTFNFSNIQSTGHEYAFASFMTKEAFSFLTGKKVKTQGGKNDILFLTNEDRPAASNSKVNRSLTSRYGKVSLAKNQTIYVYLCFCNERATISLKIS